MGPGDEGIERLRDGMVAAGRRLGQRGLIAAGEGNLSLRLPDGHLLVTPSGLRKDELAPGDLVIVDVWAAETADAVAAGSPKPTSDLAIHRAVMQVRPDVGAVAHAHLPASMVLTLAGEIPDPGVLPETALFLPRLPLVAFGAPGSVELARSIAAALTEAPEPLPGAALLDRHGAVSVGEVPVGSDRDGPGALDAALAALNQAVDRLELIEVLCRAWRDLLLLRGPATG
jgi:L-fuculose-phosphate aldolase